MPTWGLTSEQISTRPWGLDESLLRPCKTITDPVHGDVYLNTLEVQLLDSPPMQRLRRVRQLGTSHLVYPGATHSRWSHSVGTLRAAQDLLDAVWNSRTNPHTQDDLGNLLAEWAERDDLTAEFAKATVLARLGALLHDICHVPVGHTIEDDLGILISHDGNVARFERLWQTFAPGPRDAIDSADGLKEELRVLVVSKDEHAKSFKSQYPFVGDIVGNTICADLIDYLRRDHKYTGLPLSLGHRFMDSFFVVSEQHPYHAKKMVISIDRDGRRRSDIVTELIKYLRYRYELTERVLTHHAKTAADAMWGKLLELWRDDLCVELGSAAEQLEPPGEGIRLTSGEVLPEIAPAVTEAIEADARNIMEGEFLARSDDGLLEFVIDRASRRTDSKRAVAAAGLADDLLNRRLFKVIGHASREKDLAVATDVHGKFGDAKLRRALESAAADFVGLDAGWKVVLWIPSPSMRLKVAEVLVHSGRGYVAPLNQVEPASQELIRQHQRLWGVTVYAPPEVADNPEHCRALLAYMGDQMSIEFARPDGALVPSVNDLVVERVTAMHPDILLPHRARLCAFALAARDNSNADKTLASTLAAQVDLLLQACVEDGLLRRTSDATSPLATEGS